RRHWAKHDPVFAGTGDLFDLGEGAFEHRVGREVHHAQALGLEVIAEIQPYLGGDDLDARRRGRLAAPIDQRRGDDAQHARESDQKNAAELHSRPPEMNVRNAARRRYETSGTPATPTSAG